jgi:tetratricopeptide (TPR) repeat protein
MFLHAFEAISEAIKINSSDYNLYKWAGKILYHMGEFDKAEVYLKKFVNEGDIDQKPEIYALLGGTCLKNKKYKEAQDYFEMCLKLDPSNQIALKGKADCAKFAS